MILLFSLVACGGDDGSSDSASTDDALDLRLQEGDYPEPASNGAAWFGPEVRIEPGEDIMYCLVGTYDGPDVGIHDQSTYQSKYGHHLVLMGTDASTVDHPDGEIFDCTSNDNLNMASLQPITIPTVAYRDGVAEADPTTLPDGMAVKLKEGQRYIIQAHYINTGNQPILARDVVEMTFLDPDTEVDTWAAPYINTSDNWTIPAGQSATASFDCVADGTWNVLYMFGHMHQWGTSFTLDRVHDDGELEAIVDVPQWDPYYRDAPPMNHYEAGEFTIQEGDVMRTTCNWFNDTDTDLEFPHEMCVSVGLVYPQLTTVICDAGDP